MWPRPGVVAVALLAASPGLCRYAAFANLAAPSTPGPEPITVETDTGGCPARAEVIAALDVRLPGAADGRRSRSAGRRLVLDQPGSEAGMRLRLIDGDGAVTLERRLPGGRGRHDVVACSALAEAAAQVVARYLREIGYRPPAPESSAPAPPESSPAAEAPPPAPVAAPPPGPLPEAKPPAPAPVTIVARPVPPRIPARSSGWLIVPGLAASGRMGVGAGDRWARGELSLALLVRWRHLALTVAGGFSEKRQVPIVGTEPGARLALRAYPLRAALGAAFQPAARSLLVPSLGASVDWITFASSDVDQATSGGRVDAALEAAVAYLRVVGLAAVGLRLAAGWALRPRDFDADRSQPVFRTPAAYVRLELCVGFSLGTL